MKARLPITEHARQVLKTYTKMARALSSVSEKMHHHLLRSKLTISQFGVLEALYHLGPLCQRDIGAKILKTSGNITMVIDNLEKRGLVVRETDPADRRRTVVKLTDNGFALIDAVFPQHAAIAEQVFSVLGPDELETLGHLLKKLGRGDS